jgi:DNA-binding MarR family transcriptional regulator
MPVHTREAGPPPGELESLESHLLATIPPLMRHLLAHARLRPAWADMTYQQYNVLRILETEGPIAQGEIARRLLVSAPVLTRLAGSLVESELAERMSDPRDRRSVMLQLTPAGSVLVREMRKDLLAAARELLEPLPSARRRGLRAALAELRVLLPTSRGADEKRGGADAEEKRH